MLKFLWRVFCSRDLVHIFRQRTLTLLKALMLQKRVRYMSEEEDATYGRFGLDYVLWAPPRKIMHIPVFPCHFDARWGPFPQTFMTRLTLGVGMLQNLEDCGSPPLATRAPNLTRPTSLKTSNHKSMIAYLGLPLDLFGKVGEN
jgi:hypothetical protein